MFLCVFRGKGAKKDEEETGSRKKSDVRRPPPPPPPASSEKEVKGALLRRERSELARQQRDQEARWEVRTPTHLIHCINFQTN